MFLINLRAISEGVCNCFHFFNHMYCKCMYTKKKYLIKYWNGMTLIRSI